MKIAILAGGTGARVGEETVIKPKPMLEIGGRPILWHIMMHYSSYGYDNFVIALGFKGQHIKKYMVDYGALQSNLTWTVELIDTGIDTMTGGRVKRLAPYLGNETFMLAWGDSVSNIDLDKLLQFHRTHGKLATVTVVRPPARFGQLVFEGDRVTEFSEKPQTKQGWINGAFFVLEPGVFEYIDGDQTQWEKEPMQRLAKDGQLMAFCHTSFWKCVDTLRDIRFLQELWDSNNAPWKIWEG